MLGRWLVVPRGVGVATDGDGNGEVLHEDGQRSETTRKNEVEQRPELLQVVLKR